MNAAALTRRDSLCTGLAVHAARRPSPREPAGERLRVASSDEPRSSERREISFDSAAAPRDDGASLPRRAAMTNGADREFLFLLASARTDGNAERLARLAAAALPAGVRQRWLRLSELPLPAFEDHRHDGDGVYAPPEGHGRTLLDATLSATDLVFVVPLYWYSLPASAKQYLDHWSGWMRVPGVGFKARMAGKTLWVVTVLSDDDERCVDPLVGTLCLTAQYLAMRWGGALVRYGNRPGDVLTQPGALDGVDRFFAPIGAGAAAAAIA